MDFGKPAYFSDRNSFPPLILERFLPPYPNGSLSDMLLFSGIDQGWVLDPIGNQPLSDIELAQAGYQVFVACNNPILAKILQVICAAYPKSLYQAAIADFGALKLGAERLENQVKNYIFHLAQIVFPTKQRSGIFGKKTNHFHLQEK